MKTVLITGVLGGIGQALSRAFRESGYFVIGTDLHPGASTCDVFLPLNLLEMASNPHLLEKFVTGVRHAVGTRGLHTLVNNAAVQILGSTSQITGKDWVDTLQVNLLAPFQLLQSLLPDLEGASGSCVNIGSIHASLTKPGFVCYATSKAALAGMTRALAVDLGPRIRVNAINPAATATEMLMAGFAGKPELFQQLASMHPMERIAQPWEIARLAVFLASTDAAFITGSCFNINGGIGSRLHDPD